MQAVRLYAKGDLRVEDISAPAPPGPGWVTLSVTAAGICGSDLHNYRTGAWITRAPSVAGHEFTGIVVACGADVGHVAVGARVIVDSRHSCGQCPACADGVGQVCEQLGFLGEVIDGGFAEAVTLPARNVLPAPAGVPDRHLAMAEPLAVALHALNKLAPTAGAPIVVTGCGPIGGLVALLAARAGHKVGVVDQNAQRAALVARTVGGQVLDADLFGGWRFRFAVETTGHPAVLGALMGRIAGASAIALVGIGHGGLEVQPTRLVEKELSLIGCHAFGAALAQAAARLPDLCPALDAFIAEVIDLADVPAAYARHLAGQVAGLKTIIRCGGAAHV